MLTDKQKKEIELEYEDFVTMAEHPYLNGIDFMLELIGETEFKDYLYEKYR